MELGEKQIFVNQLAENFSQEYIASMVAFMSSLVLTAFKPSKANGKC